MTVIVLNITTDWEVFSDKKDISPIQFTGQSTFSVAGDQESYQCT